MPTTVIIVNGTSYGASARAANRFRAIDALVKRFDEGDDEAAFSLVGIDPVPIFTCGMTVSITVDGTTVFVGDADTVNQAPTELGWQASFTATGLKTRAARVCVTGSDGSGEAVYNRSPSDPDYVSSDAGLTVGQIVERALEISTTATALDALDVGNYTAGALPSATTTDLAALSIVPPSEVALSGENLFGQLEQLIKKWHPKYAVWIKPDGTIRVTDMFSMSAQTLTIPGDGEGDPVSPPNFTRSSQGCFTRVKIRGLDIQKAELSVLDESLVRGWSGTDETNWRYSDFIQPKDARDEGTITSLTSTSAVCDPTDATATAASNYWTPANRAGWIQLYWDAGDQIDIFETRAITASTSLSAGGTYTITWDSSTPISHTNYNKYRIVGRSGGLIDVGRLYLIKEKHTGDTGRNTFVGSRMKKRFPRPVPWANNGKSFDIETAAGLIQWSRDGSSPYIEWPVPVEIVPSLGAVRFTEPVFTASASPPLTATSAYPTTYAGGKPVDVRVAVAYNRGAMNATKPSSSWEGSAYTRLGLEREKIIPLDSWNYIGDQANMEALAQEYLDVLKDEVIEGSIIYHGYPGGFNPLVMGYALNLPIQGVTGPLDGINLPVRTVTMRWPQDAATAEEVVFQFSNRRRPFEGDDLYMHPAFNFASGRQDGSPFDNATMGQIGGVISATPENGGLVDQGPPIIPNMSVGGGDGKVGKSTPRQPELVGPPAPRLADAEGPPIAASSMVANEKATPNADLSNLDLSAATQPAPMPSTADLLDQWEKFGS